MGEGMKPSRRKCKGCTSHGCEYEEFTILCPCSSCLVKVTCRVGCGEFWDFEEFHRKSTHEELRGRIEVILNTGEG